MDPNTLWAVRILQSCEREIESLPAWGSEEFEGRQVLHRAILSLVVGQKESTAWRDSIHSGELFWVSHSHSALLC